MSELPQQKKDIEEENVSSTFFTKSSNYNSPDTSEASHIEPLFNGEIETETLNKSLTQSLQPFMGQIAIAAGTQMPEKSLNVVVELYKHHLEIERIKVQNSLENEKDSRKSLHISLGVGLLAFVSILIFSAYTSNKELPDRVVTLLFGAAGGGGGAVLLSKKSQKEK